VLIFHLFHKIGTFFLICVAGLAILGYWLAPQEQLRPADAIVAISGDQGLRFEKAIELYEEGWGDYLIFSGAADDPSSPSNAAVMKQLAIADGISPDVIFVDETSRNTKENARHVAEIIASEEIRSYILVTSPYHQRRASIEFDRVVDESVVQINYSAKDENWRRSRWWVTPRGWYLTLTEATKIAISGAQDLVGGDSRPIQLSEAL